jgi:branched-chain amino acid transport system permease protein
MTSCAGQVDADQARVCRRALPALNPEGTPIEVLRTAPGRLHLTIRIDYRVERPGRSPLDRWITCRFAAAGLAGNKADLQGVETERGPLTGAAVYLLKRYYIDTPDGVRGDPGREEQGLREVSPGLAYALQQGLVGLPRTAIYGLLAAAYALVFGLVGRINIAFGELAAVGGAATVAGVAAAAAFGVTAPLPGLALGLLAALAAGSLHAAVGGHYAIRRVAGAQGSLIATVGLSLALMEYLRLAQSPVAVWIPPVWSDALPLLQAGAFVVSITPVSLLTTGLGLLAGSGLVVLMELSRFGRAWRASADDPLAAALCGVDAGALLTRTLALSGAVAGLGGVLIVVQYGGLGFAGGFIFGLKALIAAILGGIGSVPGALLGGVAIGLFETVWSTFLPIEGRDIALYAALVVVLMVRPGGLVGLPENTPRPV